MEGLNLITAESAKSADFRVTVDFADFDGFCGFQLKTADFNEDFVKSAKKKKNIYIYAKTANSVKSTKSMVFCVKRKTTCLRR